MPQASKKVAQATPTPAPAQTFGLADMVAAMQTWHAANPTHNLGQSSTHLNGPRYANCGNVPLLGGQVLQEWVAANGGQAVTFKATGNMATFGAASVGARAQAQAAFGSPSKAGFTNAPYLTWCKAQGVNPALLQSVHAYIGPKGAKLGTPWAEIVAAMYHKNCATIELVAA
jgi:hypothetical protein